MIRICILYLLFLLTPSIMPHSVYSQACTSKSSGPCNASNASEFKNGCENPNVTVVTITKSFSVNNTSSIRVALSNQNNLKKITTNGKHEVRINGTEIRVFCEKFTLEGDFNNDGINDLTFIKTPSPNFFSLQAANPKSFKLADTNFKGEYSRVLYISKVNQQLRDLNLEVLSCDIIGFTQKGIGVNRRQLSYNAIKNVNIYNCLFEPSPNARSDGRYRAISFDAGNDAEDCGIFCTNHNASNGVSDRVAVTQRLKISGNRFVNCGIAIAKYNHVDINATKGPNRFTIDDKLPATNAAFKYKLLNIENYSNDIVMDGSIFSIERATNTEGYTRLLFVGAGSEWIKDKPAPGPNNDDGDYLCSNVRFTNNVVLPAVNKSGSNQLLDYMYVLGVKNMVISGNDFNNRATKNTPMGFGPLRWTSGSTINRYIAGNTNITITGGQEIFTKNDCKPLKVDLKTASCDGHAITPSESIVTTETVYKCNAKQCPTNNNGGNSTLVAMRKGNTHYAIDGDNGGANHQNVYQWSYNPATPNQQWEEINKGNGYYAYKKHNTNFCLDGGKGGTNGQNVFLYTCGASNQNQHWKKISVGNGKYRLEKRNAPGFSIDGGNGGANGQNLYLWTSSNSNANQQWVFSTLGNARVSAVNNIKAMALIYPNPWSEGDVTIDLRQFTKSTSVKVFDVQGKKIFETQNPPGLLKISVENFHNKGMYIVALVEEGQAPIMTKLMIE